MLEILLNWIDCQNRSILLRIFAWDAWRITTWISTDKRVSLRWNHRWNILPIRYSYFNNGYLTRFIEKLNVDRKKLENPRERQTDREREREKERRRTDEPQRCITHYAIDLLFFIFIFFVPFYIFSLFSQFFSLTCARSLSRSLVHSFLFFFSLHVSRFIKQKRNNLATILLQSTMLMIVGGGGSTVYY